jgi:1-acyl-sn-glycerol-3-phosphate acyltransferase
MFLLVFIVFMPALFFFTAIVKNEIIVATLTRYWSKLTIYLSFIFPKVELEERLSKKEQYIFCPNHVSTLDIPFILAVIPIPLQYIGKSEIAKIPLFGYFYKNNSVIVDRANRRNAYDAFLKAGEKLKKGINMCIFPEGGIPKEAVFLKKFKNGPFRLALEQNIKIIPITLPDNKSMFPQEYFKGRPGIVRIKVHKAIDPNSLTEKSTENLNTSVYNTIFEQLKNYEQ